MKARNLFMSFFNVISLFNFTKNFGREQNRSNAKNGEKKTKQKRKRFNPTINFLIVGALVIISFFSGNTSHILLIILFTGCGLFSFIKHIKAKRNPKKRYNANRRNNAE